MRRSPCTATDSAEEASLLYAAKLNQPGTLRVETIRLETFGKLTVQRPGCGGGFLLEGTMPNSSLPLRVVALLYAGIMMTQSAVASGFAVDVDKSGIALKGHDPVAYFTVGKPSMGNASFKAGADGATYHFVSNGHRDLFLADPAKYLPAYGGYCAFGVTRGVKITGDPKAWKIVADKLYINSSPDALALWSKDIPGNIKKADEIWPRIKDKNPADL